MSRLLSRLILLIGALGALTLVIAACAPEESDDVRAEEDPGVDEESAEDEDLDDADDNDAYDDDDPDKATDDNELTILTADGLLRHGHNA
ncbi:hypothetical protein ER308_02540 [Egibacter rhizosphaerae]|uniref:DNA primase n=1 Tax=Egibacter rhizosphaerae TaxID=1670831 RepID=A0A411YBE9_9ACTN|nr:hypothetical protein [Egibacter rhizosphaerae]QBI18551.1 hypothetical protein ER308_02540 [Egibacter rhizosphaerae]